MDVENSVAERKPINVPNSPKRSSLNPSLTSSVDNVIYPPSHQYHYIQYYQQPVNHYANPISQTICQCSCSCGTPQMPQPQYLHQQTTNKPSSNDHKLNTHDPFGRPQHSHQTSVDSQMVAAVIVHRQASGSNSSNDNNPTSSDHPQKSQSETSLLNHSYQALKMTSNSLLNDDILSSNNSAKTTKTSSSSCDCDLECTCNSVANGDGTTGICTAINRKEQMKQQFMLSEAMLTADEITVSESDNNSSSVKRCERNKNRKPSSGIPHNTSSIVDELNYHNANNIDIYSDGDAEAITEACLKETNGLPGAATDPRPPLPPRPPPRPKTSTGSSMTARGRPGLVVKKYVVWCLVCGGFSCILGLLFLGVYFLLHSYTITVGNFETVPTFVPATLLILTGLCVMSLARRRNRYSYLIKLSGACGLISALTCALVTVTTTVLHMSRLQALRECEYAQKTRTCTCYSDLIESQVDRVDKEGVRLVFDSLSDCGVVHGSLYSCLRAIFGLSVAGVLVAVFSCMLVYQLLSHERKKMYWEQLELRCRSLYTRPQMPSQNLAAIAAPHGCRCCEQCHAHRQVPLQAAAYPWDESSEPRFWSTQPPGNFYSPNPGGEDLMGMSNTCRRHEMTTSRSRGSGWSWHRWWQRSSPDPNSRFRQTPSSPDSQYGFSNTNTNAVITMAEDVNAVVGANQQQYNVLPGNLPYGVWGPPPPYSDPNSPARRGYYQYIQPAHLHAAAGGTAANVVPMNANITDGSHGVFIDQPAASSCCQQNIITRSNASTVGSVSNFKSKVEYENTPSDSDCGSNIRERDRFSNTLPTRKIKKRLDPGNKSIGPNSQSAQRINLQQVFSPISDAANNRQYQEPHILADDMRAKPQKLNNMCGVENTGFQNSCESTSPNMDQEAVETSDPTESEVYFADVSSCCNMSVKNDHYYEDARASQKTLIPSINQQQAQPQQQLHNHSHSHSHHHHHQRSSCSSTTNEDYLAQRFGQRENSIRSRLPFPQSAQCTIEGSFVDNIQIVDTAVQDHTNLSNCHSSHLPKDPSCQSMCSMESDAKTEFTDLSPLTPCGQNPNQLNDFAEITSQGHSTPTNFVSSSYPYSSESQSVEALRRSTKNLTEAHYEVIDDQQLLTPSLPSTQDQHQPNNRIASRRTTKTPAKTSPRERKDNSEREWSDAGAGDRHRL